MRWHDVAFNVKSELHQVIALEALHWFVMEPYLVSLNCMAEWIGLQECSFAKLKVLVAPFKCSWKQGPCYNNDRSMHIVRALSSFFRMVVLDYFFSEWLFLRGLLCFWEGMSPHVLSLRVVCHLLLDLSSKGAISQGKGLENDWLSFVMVFFWKS